MDAEGKDPSSRQRNGQNHSIEIQDKPFATFAGSDGDFPVGELSK